MPSWGLSHLYGGEFIEAHVTTPTNRGELLMAAFWSPTAKNIIPQPIPGVLLDHKIYVEIGKWREPLSSLRKQCRSLGAFIPSCSDSGCDLSCYPTEYVEHCLWTYVVYS